MNKKGEMTTEQIVMIIVLIVSFIVILYFLLRLNLGGTTNDEICHNSVVLKSKSAGLVGGLTCKTDYICISGGGTCANLNPTSTVNVDATNKDEIMKAIADQMSNCWFTFGEGNANYLSISDKSALTKTTCALCSTIVFDDKILSKNYGITYNDFYNYLMNTKKDNSQTYLNYLYGVSDLNTLQQKYPLIKDVLNNNVVASGQYGVLTGYTSGVAWGLLSNTLIYPTYLPSSQISSELKCADFVTTAS
jgi:hypothetical protein